MKEAKPFVIDKTLIYKAYLKVKENKGSAGVDSVGIEDYEKDLGNRLYKLWNRMSSGSLHAECRSACGDTEAWWRQASLGHTYGRRPYSPAGSGIVHRAVHRPLL